MLSAIVFPALIPPLHGTSLIRLLLAVVLGMCIGAERQWRQRSAGLRTNTLVCLGAAAFVSLGETIAPNTTQVIAYVVSGVGFLGAGAIMKEGVNVRGLNTAATLWCSAAVGACAGSGELLDAVFVAALLMTVNSALRFLSRAIDRRSLAAFNTLMLYRLQVVCDREHEHDTADRLTRAIAERSLVLRELAVAENDSSDSSLLQAVVESHVREKQTVDELTELLENAPGVQSVSLTANDADAE